LRASLREAGEAHPLDCWLRDLRTSLPFAAAEEGFEDLPRLNAVGWRRALRGPRSVEVDSAFDPSFSLLEFREPGFQPQGLGSTPYLWGLSVREATAGQSATAMLIEFDGLPLSFYLDLARQAWDEARHATFFLDAAIRLLPEYLASIPLSHRLRPACEQYLRTGHGLPVPRERLLYSLHRGFDLPERVMLFHLGGEATSVRMFTQQLRTPFYRSRPWLRRGVEQSLYEEAAHARFGEDWLPALLPDVEERASRLHSAISMREIFALTTLANENGRTLDDLLQQLRVRGAPGPLA